MVKKLLLVVVVLFLGFWMFTDPHGLAHTTKSSAGQTWDFSTQLFTALITFLRALSRGSPHGLGPEHPQAPPP
jgi:hypothetical protein